MRARIRLTSPEGTPEFTTPWDYHLSIHSWIQQSVQERAPEVAEEMHTNPTAPPYAFSRLVPTKSGHTSISEQHGLQMDDAFLWVVSSNQTVLESVVEAAQTGNPPLTLGHTRAPVASVTIEDVEPYDQKAEYVTLSPIAVSMKREGLIKYLPYDDPMWGRRVVDLCQKQQEEWYAGGADEEFKFDIQAVQDANVTTRTSPGGHRQVDCTVARLVITADAQTSYHIQLQGVGARTGQGFGFVMPRLDLHDEADPEVL